MPATFSKLFRLSLHKMATLRKRIEELERENKSLNDTIENMKNNYIEEKEGLEREILRLKNISKSKNDFLI